MVTSPNDEAAPTALSHTPRTPPLSAALGAFADASQAHVDSADGPADGDALDLSLMKKKKKKKVVEEAVEDDADGAGDDAADDEVGLDVVCAIAFLTSP
jgi:translation initiation factor 2 subunit 2